VKPRTAAEGVLALGLALAVLATAAMFGSGRGRDADLRSSSWNDDRRGAHALYLLLGDLGVPVERSAEPPTVAAPTDRTLVVLAPSWAVTKTEAAALLDWTARGGRLVVVDAPSTPPALTVDVDVLLHPLGLQTKPALGSTEESATTTTRDEWRREMRALTWPARLVLAEHEPEKRDPRAGESDDLVANDQGTIATLVPFGEGEVVAIADESLFANEQLGHGDGAVLAARLLVAPGRTVVFDEFHHGFTPTGTRADLVERLAGMLVHTWLGRALVLLGVAGLVYAAGAAVRLGAPLPEPRPARRAMREHADALGRLFEGAHASHEALEILSSGVRRTCGARAGYAPGLPPAEFRRRLDRSLAPAAKELASALATAEAAAERPSVKDVELARIAANLAAAKRRFLHGGS
jgi:hypothetical protein